MYAVHCVTVAQFSVDLAPLAPAAVTILTMVMARMRIKNMTAMLIMPMMRKQHQVVLFVWMLMLMKAAMIIMLTVRENMQR